MLVLSRRKDQSIQIGDDVIVKIVDVRGDRVRLGIEAPTEIVVDRSEVAELKRKSRGKEEETVTV